MGWASQSLWKENTGDDGLTGCLAFNTLVPERLGEAANCKAEDRGYDQEETNSIRWPRRTLRPRCQTTNLKTDEVHNGEQNSECYGNDAKIKMIHYFSFQ